MSVFGCLMINLIISDYSAHASVVLSTLVLIFFVFIRCVRY